MFRSAQPGMRRRVRRGMGRKRVLRPILAVLFRCFRGQGVFVEGLARSRVHCLYGTVLKLDICQTLGRYKELRASHEPEKLPGSQSSACTLGVQLGRFLRGMPALA